MMRMAYYRGWIISWHIHYLQKEKIASLLDVARYLFVNAVPFDAQNPKKYLKIKQEVHHLKIKDFDTHGGQEQPFLKNIYSNVYLK